MGCVNYCLICLATGVKMYSMNYTMIKIYNEIILRPHTWKLEQMYACYECAYLLYKYEKFKTKCSKAYNILCSCSPNPLEVTEDCLSTIDRERNELESTLTSLILTYEYDPEEEECSLDQFNIEKLDSEPIIHDNELPNDEDDDPLQIIQTQDLQLDSKSSSEHDMQDDYHVLIVNNTPDHDIEDDYKFMDTFQIESSNYNSNTDTMLWLTIQSKENAEEADKTTSIQLDEDYFDTDNNCDILDDYMGEQTLEIQIDPYVKDDNNQNMELELLDDLNDNQIVKDLSQIKKENKGYDVSDTDFSGLLSLDSKILNDHMIVTELTPDDARREFLLRKNSSNYTRNPYKCDLCYRGFLSQHSYESHSKKHSLKNGNFQCDICKLYFIGKPYLNQHRIRMHKRKFSCKLCPYICYAQTQCTAHIQSHIGKKYTCNECGVTYSFRNSLLTHMHFKHNVECVCEFCGSTFVSTKGLFSHKHIVHRQEKNDFLGPRCDECDVHFASEMAWKRHRVLCTRHEVQFGCKVCGDSFQDSDRLKTHLREHGTMDYSTRKNYLVKTCVFCKIGLPDNMALSKHLLTEHPTEITNGRFKSNSETSYVCEFCGKAFQRRLSLISHHRKHSDEMPYSCPDCGVRTKYKHNLILHRRIHTGEYNDKFQCDLCGRPFSDKGRLARHIRGHMGIRPFKCVACDKSFMFRCDERAHYKHVHDNVPYPKKSESKNRRKRGPFARIKIFDDI